MQPITIELTENEGYVVRQGDRYCDYLQWDEMLGQVAQLSNPGNARLYPMLTAEEHAEKLAAHQARMAEIRQRRETQKQ